MHSDAYSDFFLAVAGATGALIGLLFVAVSISVERAMEPSARLEFRSRASSALLLFTNALVLSLVALIPGVSLGFWALAMAVIMMTFAAATARLMISAARHHSGPWRSLTLALALAALAVAESLGAVERLNDPDGVRGLTTLAYVLVTELAVGIARAWQLVGLRDTGLLASLHTLARGDDD